MRRLSMTGHCHKLWRGRPSGTAAVEFGLAAPILALLVVALVDFGFGFYDYLTVRGATSAGAQYASLYGFTLQDTGTAGPIVNAVTNTAKPLSLASVSAVQVCGCPTSTGIQNEKSVPSNGLCSTLSCAGFGCTVSGTSLCPASTYAKITATYSYSPIAVYPWAKTPLKLSGLAYRRLQ